MDAVAQVEQKSRKQKRINLAWEDPAVQAQDDGEGSDEDVPLAMLYAKKSRDMSRPMGLMERRDMEDNEPLSQRRNRLQGRPLAPRAATMMNLSGPDPTEEEGETLAERVGRLKEGGNEGGLPATRPVSGDFASEMMSQFGGDVLNPKDKGKGREISSSPPPEEEETLGQRRKRLQAEREARAKEVGTLGEAPQRPGMKTRRSMADLLQAHPSAGADRAINYQKPVGGLLGMHEKNNARRSSTMLNLSSPNLSGAQAQRAPSSGFKAGQFNDGKGGIVPPPQQQQIPFNMYGGNALFPQPSLGNINGFNQNGFNSQMMMPFANPYAMPMGMGYNPNAMSIPMPMGYNPNLAMGMQMGQGMQPLNQGQLDMVERWRQSVMQ